jgi:hypothetical protein
VPLLGPPQDPQPLGHLVGLPGGGPQRVLGQHQPLPGRGQLPPTPPPPGQRRHLLGGGLLVGAGLLTGLLGLGGALGGQLQLPRAIRRTGRAELGEPIPFGAYLAGGQPPHIHQVRKVTGEGLAAVTGKHPGQQLLGRP